MYEGWQSHEHKSTNSVLSPLVVLLMLIAVLRKWWL